MKSKTFPPTNNINTKCTLKPKCVSVSSYQCVSMTVCQCVCMSVCQYVSMSVCQFFSMSVCQCVSRTVCQCVCMSVCLCISVSVSNDWPHPYPSPMCPARSHETPGCFSAGDSQNCLPKLHCVLSHSFHTTHLLLLFSFFFISSHISLLSPFSHSLPLLLSLLLFSYSMLSWPLEKLASGFQSRQKKTCEFYSLVASSDKCLWWVPLNEVWICEWH